MKLSVCIPMYNESGVIAETARTLSEYMEAHFEDYEILFCSDGSTDGCDEIVRALALPHTRVLSYTPNHGKGRAVRTAMLAASGDIRIFTDADLAYGAEILGEMAEQFQAHPEASLVIGSRNLKKDGYSGYTRLRRWTSKAYIRVLCIAGGFRLSDSQCGCKGFTAEAAEAIFPRCEVDGFAFDFEAILWADKMGMKIHEMPARVLNHDRSTVHVVRDTLRMLRDLRRMKRRIRKTPI